MIQNLAEFEKQLAQGRGGAALFIEQNLPLPNEYRDALLHACLHDLRYDHQSEDGRGLYLFDLIGKTGEVEFYRSRILEVLPEHEIREDKTDYDLLQGMELARIFAQTGDAPAHEVLYTTFEKNATRGDLIGGDELVHLDGVDGLLFLVDRYDDEENGFDLSDFDLRLMNVEERDGEESAQQELKSKCAGLPIREAWLARLNVYRKERKQSRKNQPKRPRQTYEDFRQTIASRGRKMRNGRGWVKRATEAEIAQAANDLLRESDPEWLIPC